MMALKRIHHILFVTFAMLTVGTLPFSVRLCSWAIILLTLNWIIEGQFTSKWQRLKKNRLIWLFSGFYLLYVVGLIFTEDMATGLFNLEKKLSLFIFPIVLGTSHQLSAREIKYIFNTFIAVCISAIGISFLLLLFDSSIPDPVHVNFDYLNEQKFREAFTGSAETWSLFSYIGFGSIIHLHPTYFSLYITFAIGLLFAQHYNSFDGYSSIKKAALILIMLVMITTLVFLSSRIVLFSFLIIFLATLFWFFFIQQRKSLRGAAYSFALSLFIASLIYINPITRFRLVQEPLNSGFSYAETSKDWNSFNLRILQWSSSIKIIKVNWLTGVGTGDIQKELNEEYAAFDLGIFDLNLNAHNQYLQTALGVGLVGILFWIFSLLYPFITAWKENFTIYLYFIFLFSMCCLTESMLEMQKGVVFYSFFNSLLIFQVDQLNSKKDA